MAGVCGWGYRLIVLFFYKADFMSALKNECLNKISVICVSTVKYTYVLLALIYLKISTKNLLCKRDKSYFVKKSNTNFINVY